MFPLARMGLGTRLILLTSIAAFLIALECEARFRTRYRVPTYRSSYRYSRTTRVSSSNRRKADGDSDLGVDIPDVNVSTDDAELSSTSITVVIVASILGIGILSCICKRCFCNNAEREEDTEPEHGNVIFVIPLRKDDTADSSHDVDNNSICQESKYVTNSSDHADDKLANDTSVAEKPPPYDSAVKQKETAI